MKVLWVLTRFFFWLIALIPFPLLSLISDFVYFIVYYLTGYRNNPNTGFGRIAGGNMLKNHGPIRWFLPDCYFCARELVIIPTTPSYF